MGHKGMKSSNHVRKRLIKKESECNSDGSASTKSNSFKVGKSQEEDLDSVNIAKSSDKALPYIGTINEAPEFIKKSTYILNGYRINFGDVKTILRSLFILHNETTNVWSHLSGVFVYVFLSFYILFWTATDDKSTYKDEDSIYGLPVGLMNAINSFIAKHILWIDEEVVGSPDVSKIPMMIHMAGSIVCMALSSGYHLFCCHSKDLNCKLYKYDYTGVSVMIACSIYPPYVYGFMCPQRVFYAYFYTSVINISSFLLVVVCIHPKFDNEKLRWLRAFMYCVVGLSCGIPGVHATFFPEPDYLSFSNVYLWSLGGFFFVFGAFVYTKRFPEKKYPGKFDYFGQSHNIWHIFVLLGGVTNFFASLSSYYGRRIHVCPQM